ncbi:hypothetical protein Bbelb_083870 [Branchiostoma belcheri]|nr:hypothetical protein Bbelb_083870 [Branchiostoma belcheri]
MVHNFTLSTPIQLKSLEGYNADELIDHLMTTMDYLRTRHLPIGLALLAIGDFNHLSIRDTLIISSTNARRLCGRVRNHSENPDVCTAQLIRRMESDGEKDVLGADLQDVTTASKAVGVLACRRAKHPTHQPGGVRLRYYIDRESSSNGKNTHSCINTGMPADGIRPRIFRIRHPWSGTLCQNSQGRCGNQCKKQEETVKTPLVPGRVSNPQPPGPHASQTL